MNIKMTVLAVGCALALAACGNNAPADNAQTTPPPAASAAPATAPAPAGTAAMTGEAAGSNMAPAADATAATKGAAVVADCATEIEGNDAMQYNVSSIVVPSSCTDFKITLKHTGKLPVTAMGHDVVITKDGDVAAVDADAMKAGADAGYIKADDARVIAHTGLVGGGETTSVSFPVSKIKDGGPYTFFCSFPGHSAMMRGTISVQ